MRVASVGCPIPGLDGLPGYSYHGFVDAPDYPHLLSELRVDIGLAPLRDTIFNRAKSDVKYLEYAATGAAVIASPVSPYRAAIAPDRGLIVPENTPEAWDAAIEELVTNGARRRGLAQAAYDWVRQERSIEATDARWYALFQAYANGEISRAAPGTDQLVEQRFRRVMANIVIRQTPYDAEQLLSLLTRKATTALGAKPD